MDNRIGLLKILIEVKSFADKGVEFFRKLSIIEVHRKIKNGKHLKNDKNEGGNG